MLAHTKKSYEANQDFSTSTSVPSHGWIERERRERESRKGNGAHTATEDQNNILDDQRISQTVKEVKGAHPNIKLDLASDNRSITVGLLSQSQASNVDMMTGAICSQLLEAIVQSQYRSRKRYTAQALCRVRRNLRAFLIYNTMYHVATKYE